MSAPHPPTVLWDEIQQLRLDLQNGFQQVQTDLQKLRSDVYPDLMRVINQNRLDGRTVPFRIVPFKNGDDPTQPPHNLPHLASVVVIKQLNEQQVNSYLTGYGIDRLPSGSHPDETDYLWGRPLVRAIGGFWP